MVLRIAPLRLELVLEISCTAAGAFTIGLTPLPTLSGINALIFGYDASNPLDTDIDLAAVPLGSTPFVAAGGTGTVRIAEALAQRAARDGDLPNALVAALGAAPPDPAAVGAEIEAAEEGFRLLRLILSDGEEGAEALRGETRLAPEAWNA